MSLWLGHPAMTRGVEMNRALPVVLALHALCGCDGALLHNVPELKLSDCGDGALQEGEECDDGPLNSDRLADAC